MLSLPVVVSGVVAGLLICGHAGLRLRAARRAAAGRHLLSARVVAATDDRLVLLLPGLAASCRVDVDRETSVHWRQVLALGPPEVEEPDLGPPSDWDRVDVLHAAELDPAVVILAGVAQARQQAMGHLAVGISFVVVFLLATTPAAMLYAVGIASCAIAVPFALSAKKTVVSWWLVVVFTAIGAAAIVSALRL